MTDDHRADDRRADAGLSDDRSDSGTDPGPVSGRETTPAEEDWGRVPIDLSAANDGNEGDEPANVISSDGAETESYAPEPSSAPVEPGTPTFENALFVALGALVMLLIMSRLFTVALG
ncbi:hypothetical protein OB905_05105 [Halobacteria archaeon AArc-dxtr1]|nr:hypothetical protein [Halobacteria archaeon AArc-dxtr1]